MLDVWVCSNCHSINRERAAVCYKCGAPREQATGEGAGMRPVRAIHERLVNGYRSTVELAILTSALILVVVFVEIYRTIVESGTTNAVYRLLDDLIAGGAFDRAAWEAPLAATDRLALPTIVAFVAAIAAFATWLSVTVGNVPGLGGGEPSVTPVRAFAWSVIPVVNLRRIPQILQEVLYRLDPRAGGVFMVGLAWIGLVGSWIVARIVGLYLDARIQFDAADADSLPEFAQSLKQLLEGAFILDVVTTAMISFGSIMLIVIIVQIERRAAARNREIEAELATRH
jgi:uncharacterized protein DUF4328